jgi:hypothetical protein
VRLDLQGWNVERRTDLESGGEGDVVVVDFTRQRRGQEEEKDWTEGGTRGEDDLAEERRMKRQGRTMIRMDNVYDAPELGRATTRRPARPLDWGRIIDSKTIMAGDFNAHSPVWNPMMLPSKRTASAGFLEGLIHEYALVVWNDEQATISRNNAENHSIIDLTITAPHLILRQQALEEENDATSSDHMHITWVVAVELEASSLTTTSSKVTGLKIEEMGGKEEEAAAA